MSRLGTGASATVPDGSGWAYFPTEQPGTLGIATLWAHANQCAPVNLIVDEGGQSLAFAADGFDQPPQIWRAKERTLVAVTAEPPTIEEPPNCPQMVEELAASGLDIVADHGVWLGEINGLEVARVGIREGECSIDIGVGAYDQFASATLAPDRDVTVGLEHVASMVRPHRSATSEPHPIGRLVRSRWLRAQIVSSPALVGLETAEAVPLLIARPGLNEAQPAAALGQRTGQSGPVLVVCAVGVDPALPETAAGLAKYHSVDEVVIVMPSRDSHPRVIEALDSLAVPTSVVHLEGEWS